VVDSEDLWRSGEGFFPIDDEICVRVCVFVCVHNPIARLPESIHKSAVFESYDLLERD